jgi:Family of unknown function (DUF5709)
MSTDNFPEPVSDPEAEGLPDTADDDRTAYDDVDSPRVADGPDPAALPADRPLAVDRYGVTPEEARIGESLDYKLSREVPDSAAGAASDGPGSDGAVGDPGGSAPSRGDDVDLVSDELDGPDPDAGLADDWAPDSTDSPVSMYDRPDVIPDAGRPIGRLVEPDEGAHEDREKDAVAWDAGAAGGGASAEELAIHEER